MVTPEGTRSGPGRANRFPPGRRLKKGSEFESVWNARLFAADGILVVNAAATEPSRPSRLGLSVGRRVGNAVVRNRWKRLIREAFRLEQHNLPAGWDLVVRPKAGAVPDAGAVRRSLPQLVRRIQRNARPR